METVIRINTKSRYIWLIAGMLGCAFGMFLAVPAYLNYNYPLAISATVLIFFGLLATALSYGAIENEFY